MAEAAAEGFAPEHSLELDVARAWVGYRVDDVTGSTAGRVEGVFADAETGEPAWLVIRIGRLGNRTAVPFEYAAAGGDGHVWLPYRKAELKAAPEVDPAAGAKAGLERRLCDHYELRQAHPRRGRLGDRDPDELSCVPA